MQTSLVQPLVPGPVDIVGDVHGEIDALLALLDHLGYAPDGTHPAGRHLVFVGDLVDRGPDSPAVVAKVRSLVANGAAQSVLGNHELNLLRQSYKVGNRWFLGEAEALDPGGPIIAQAFADPDTRRDMLAFFQTLPLVLERDDLCVVHACWSSVAVEQVRRYHSVVPLFQQAVQAINEDLEQLAGNRDLSGFVARYGLTLPQAVALFTGHDPAEGVDAEVIVDAITDTVGRGLVRQNLNPVKLLTSGSEQRISTAFYMNGRWRREQRCRWWQTYTGPALCVFGHYWRHPLDQTSENSVFHGIDPFSLLGDARRAMCVDYSVGKRYLERLERPGQPFERFLAALRYPEMLLLDDSGRVYPIR
jgi:hypothetical protein